MKVRLTVEETSNGLLATIVEQDALRTYLAGPPPTPFAVRCQRKPGEPNLGGHLIVRPIRGGRSVRAQSTADAGSHYLSEVSSFRRLRGGVPNAHLNNSRSQRSGLILR